MLVRLAFLVSLLGAFPLQMAPARDALWTLLFRQELQVRQRRAVCHSALEPPPQVAASPGAA